MFWKMGPGGGGAPTIRLPRWLFEVHRAASLEVWARLRAAEAVPVVPKSQRDARRARAQGIREAARHLRALDAALFLCLRWLRVRGELP